MKKFLSDKIHRTESIKIALTSWVVSCLYFFFYDCLNNQIITKKLRINCCHSISFKRKKELLCLLVFIFPFTSVCVCVCVCVRANKNFLEKKILKIKFLAIIFVLKNKKELSFFVSLIEKKKEKQSRQIKLKGNEIIEECFLLQLLLLLLLLKQFRFIHYRSCDTLT